MPKATRGPANLILWPAILAGLSVAGYFVFEKHQAAALLEKTSAELASLDQLDQRWVDAARVLEQTPRIALAPQIATAQALAREYSALQLETCAAQVAQARGVHVRAQVETMLAFMANDSDAKLRRLREAAALAEVDALRATSHCAPGAEPMTEQTYADLRRLHGG
jgi:hypothetical protein